LPEIYIEVPFADYTRFFGLTKEHAKEWINSLSEAIAYIDEYNNAVEALYEAQCDNP